MLKQVETRTLEELEELLEFSSQNRTSLTRIMLDNMVVPLPNGDVDVSMLKDAVQLVNGRFETEFFLFLWLEIISATALVVLGQSSSGMRFNDAEQLTYRWPDLDISGRRIPAWLLQSLSRFREWISRNLFTNLKYSRVEIDEMQFEWAEYMLDYI
ncbi:hypothetical protein ZIOFF_046101 [Zingiber officinale]|uniref:Uncharacterized protein n=1 Tax=Zingiber officinale TaxID=94328 RepID=A0A8J5KVV6_ZINOF|nr:hypothetical protein ZIOFF_046101 [Zingiber officinale]